MGTILLGICVILFLLAYYVLNGMVSVHMQASSGTPSDYNLPFEKVVFKSSDKTLISGWYIKTPNPKGAVVVVHGYLNPGGRSTMLGHAAYLYDAGYSSLLIDLGGFGESNRSKVTLGILESEDVLYAYKYLLSLPENHSIPVGLLGYSMGAVSVMNASGKHHVGDFVIELDGYRSIDALLAVELSKRGLPAPLLLPFMQISSIALLGSSYPTYAPERLVSDIRVPLLIIHGSKDTAVPVEQGQYLYSIANEPKKIVILSTSHDIFTEDPTGVKQAVLLFLDSVHK